MTTRNLLIFFGGWFLLNGLQSFFTDLANDEAYYWVYSLRMDWGYFDHPPMVALFIKLGYTIFHNEFGVRLFTILSQVAALVLTYQYLIPDHSKQTRSRSIMLVMALIPILHVFAFIATPDGPILLTAVIFLILYKRFLTDNSCITALLMGTSMALMLYSKYHGVLIIGFIILSNPKLLLDYKFWAGSLFGACLFIPHLVWQVTNDFPSLRFHLVDRSDPFEFKVLWVYLMNQLINFNPVILVIVCFNVFRSKLPTDKFERGLIVLMMGFFLFFLVMTLRGHIEPQWTYVLVIPILYLAVTYASDRQLRAIVVSGWVIFPVLLLGRAVLIFDLLPLPNEFHGYPKLVKEIQKRANGLPVFILNSYQLTSKYYFYTQEPAYGMNAGGRHNQFDIWSDEEQFFGKQVYVVSRGTRTGFEEIDVNGPYGAFGRIMNDFGFYKDIRISSNTDKKTYPLKFTESLKIQNPYNTRIELGDETHLLMFLVNDKNERIEIKLDVEATYISPDSESSLQVRSREPIPSGSYTVRFGLQRNQQFYSINSSSYSMIFQ